MPSSFSSFFLYFKPGYIPEEAFSMSDDDDDNTTVVTGLK